MGSLRIALVGVGMIGRRHLEVLEPDPAYEVAGVSDPAPTAADFARQRGLAYFADYEAMLDATRPDGVIVATPNQLHRRVALAAIARGLPVLVEKPVADSLAAALEVVAAAERARVPVLVGHHRRHNPIMRRAAEILHGGGIGKLVAVNAVWLSHKPADYFAIAWRREAGGGPVLINAIHDIDCLRMLCGEIDTIEAATAALARPHPVEDTAAAVIRFASGALGTLLVSDAASAPWSWEWTSRENPFYPHEPRDCYLVAGTAGSLAVPTLEHAWHEPGQGWGDPLTRRRVPYTPADPYIEQMRNFAEVIRGAASPVVSGLEGTRTLAATLAISRSAAERRPVRPAELIERG